MRFPAARTASTIAMITVAACTAWVPIAAADPFGTGSAGPGAQAPGTPPKPSGGDGKHNPGDPCKIGNNPGHYEWQYDSHYGWGWQLNCINN